MTVNNITVDTYDFDILGRTAKDLVSGTLGRVTSICESRSGSIQITIEPRGMLGRPVDAYSYDFQQVQVQPDKTFASRFRSRLPVVPVDSMFDLGARVKDISTNQTGVILRRTTYMNGCILCSILPDGEKKYTEMIHVYQTLLEPAEAGVEGESHPDISVDWDILKGFSSTLDLVPGVEEAVEEEKAKDKTSTKKQSRHSGGKRESSVSSSI